MKLEISTSGKPYILLDDGLPYSKSDRIILSNITSESGEYNHLVFYIKIFEKHLKGKKNKTKETIISNHKNFTTELDMSGIPNSIKNEEVYSKIIQIKSILTKYIENGTISKWKITQIKKEIDSMETTAWKKENDKYVFKSENFPAEIFRNNNRKWVLKVMHKEKLNFYHEESSLKSCKELYNKKFKEKYC